MQTVIETEWEFANAVAQETRSNPLSVGTHHLHIDKAMYVPDTHIYTLTLRSLDTDEVSEMRFYMLKNDGTRNNMAIHTMNTLKKAITGTGDGCLLPNQVEDAIVIAQVKMGKPYLNSKGETVAYPQIYDFEPVSAEYFGMAALSESIIAGQYTIKDGE